MSGISRGPSLPTTDAASDRGLAVKETSRLIGSDRVEGTAVYDRQSNHLGSVQNVMINKVSGQVAYVVISFGGFLGIGSQYYPLPWKTLTYDESVGGYVVDINRDTLESAPKYAADEEPWIDPRYGHTVDDYYHVPYQM